MFQVQNRIRPTCDAFQVTWYDSDAEVMHVMTETISLWNYGKYKMSMENKVSKIPKQIFSFTDFKKKTWNQFTDFIRIPKNYNFARKTKYSQK